MRTHKSNHAMLGAFQRQRPQGTVLIDGYTEPVPQAKMFRWAISDIDLLLLPVASFMELQY